MKNRWKNRMADPENREAATDAPKKALPRKAACPFCGSRVSYVERTIGADRVRICKSCGMRFRTHEKSEQEK